MAGEAVTQVVQPHSVQSRFLPNVPPKVLDIDLTARCRVPEYLRLVPVAREALQDGPRRIAKPHRPWSGLAVGQQQAAAPDLAPGKAGNLRFAATRQDQQVERRTLQWTGIAVPVNGLAQSPELLIGQEPLALPAPVHADHGAGVRAFGHDPPFLGLVHHGAQDVAGTVGRAGAACLARAVEPFLHMAVLDLVQEHPCKGALQIVLTVEALRQ